jgi:hypothetical protein
VLKRSINKYKFLVALTGGVLYSAIAVAQSADSAWVDMDFLRQSHAWLNTNQATGLQFMPAGRVSVASLSGKKSDGSFRNFYQSDNSYTVNANTASIHRLNQKVVFAGRVDYEYFKGKNMGGSAFIDPYRNAIDIDENADSTAGSKTIERYLLMGAVSAQLTSRLTVAGSVNYVAANYAKLKDLRHANKLMDLEAQAGISYRLSQQWMVGASYTYNRRTESVRFDVLGNTDRQYLSLINFGSFYGIAQLHTDYSYTSETRPVVDDRNMGAVQIGWTIKPGVELFQQFSYQQRTGYYGERGLATIVFTEHEGSQFGSTTALSIRKNNTLQYAKLTARYEKLENFENVYTTGTAPSGNRIVTYIGQNRVMNNDQTYIAGEYGMYWDIHQNQPRWMVQVQADYTDRSRTAVRYPYYRIQQFSNYYARVTGKRTWPVKKMLYTAGLGVGYGGGTGTAKNDGLYAPPSSSQVPPASRDIYLYQEYEYFTAPRAELLPSVQVSREVKSNLLVFANLSASITKAWNTSINGRDFREISFTIGCNF